MCGGECEQAAVGLRTADHRHSEPAQTAAAAERTTALSKAVRSTFSRKPAGRRGRSQCVTRA